MERSEPDYMDLDNEDKYGWCEHCAKDVVVVKRDVGVGAYEFWGCKGVHIDMRDHCGTCENEL